ncbi:hypothetical protein GA0115240_124010, partial [Streptomyces sp. DvalAA-14]
MVGIYLAAESAPGAAGFAGDVPTPPVPERGRLLAALPRLAVGEAVFLPADPPRRGQIAFWTPGGDPPDLGVEPVRLTAAVPAVLVPVEQALPLLARCRALGADGSGRASAGTAFWGAAAVLGLSLLARGRVLAGVSPGGSDAWRMGPLDARDEERVASLAAAMPPEARAATIQDFSPPAAEPLLRTFLDAMADALTRTRLPPRGSAPRGPSGGDAFAARPPRTVPEAPEAPEARPARAASQEAGLEVSLRLELAGRGPPAGRRPAAQPGRSDGARRCRRPVVRRG